MGFRMGALLAAGMIAAFVFGRFSAPVPVADEAEPADAPRKAESQPKRPEGLGEGQAWGDLRRERERLQLGLAALGSRLKAAERKAARYDAFREMILRDGSVPDFHAGFDRAVPESLLDFLDLDEATEERLAAACEQAFDDIREWEKRSAVVMEKSDLKVVYQLPGMTNDFAEQLDDSLAEILDPEDRELVLSAFCKGHERLHDPREVVFTLKDGRDPDLISFELKVKALESGKFGSWSSSSSGSYHKDSPMRLNRWSHLFAVE